MRLPYNYKPLAQPAAHAGRVAQRSGLIDVRELDGGEDNSGSEFGGVDHASGLRMISQFFSDGFGELRADMPEK